MKDSHTGEKKVIWLKNNYIRNQSLIQEDFASTSKLQEGLNKLKDNYSKAPVVCELVEQFTCSYCGKQCLDKRRLQRHVRFHTGECPFLCNICDATFKQKGHLTVHHRIHTGDKPFKCTLCSYKSNENSNLKRHVNSKHTC